MHKISDVANFQHDILYRIEGAVDEEHSHFITHSDTMIVIGILTSPEISYEPNQTKNQSNLNFLANSVIALSRTQWGSVGLEINRVQKYSFQIVFKVGGM